MRSAPIRDAGMLGLVLRDARLRRNMSQRELAKLINVHQSYVAEIEAGKDVKAIERLLAFARETGVKIYLNYPDD